MREPVSWSSLEFRGTGAGDGFAAGGAEGEFAGVEREAWRGAFALAVEDVAQDRCAQAPGHPLAHDAREGARSGGVDAELVGAACDGLEANARAVCFAREDAVAGLGWSAIDPVDDLVRAVGGVEADGDVDETVIGGVCAFDEGGVGLVDAAEFELA